MEETGNRPVVAEPQTPSAHLDDSRAIALPLQVEAHLRSASNPRCSFPQDGGVTRRMAFPDPPTMATALDFRRSSQHPFLKTPVSSPFRITQLDQPHGPESGSRRTGALGPPAEAGYSCRAGSQVLAMRSPAARRLWANSATGSLLPSPPVRRRLETDRQHDLTLQKASIRAGLGGGNPPFPVLALAAIAPAAATDGIPIAIPLNPSRKRACT